MRRCAVCGRRTSTPRRKGFTVIALCPRHREWVASFGNVSPHEVGVLIGFARVFGTIEPREVTTDAIP
jgi:hypothetical protein